MGIWDTLASDERIQKTVTSLEAHGIHATVVENGAAAKAKVLELIPKGSEVMTMTSVTLDAIGVNKEINKSGNFDAVHPKLSKMDRATQGREMQKMGAAPEWVIGSVHAVTTDGEVLIASNTGSQLPAYAYGAAHVIWVVGTQKIVENKEDGMKRLYEHSLMLENERVKKAYGMPHSAIRKILIVDGEVKPDRITIIFVKEVLGF